MYKLMIVDDEADIREGLIEVVDFSALGFEVVGEAENGADALRLAELTQPDLVITDIRMPIMDGLTMATHMRKSLPTVQFVILSGYDEFEYARQAIEITALRYLLKPISSTEIIAVLQKVKKKMDEEFERQRDMHRLQAYFESSLPVLREALLSSLLMGTIDVNQAHLAASRYRMQLVSPVYTLALVRIHGQTSAAQHPIDDPELQFIAVRNTADEIFEQKMPCYTFHFNSMLAVLMLLPNAGHSAFAAGVDALEELCQKAQRFVGCQVLIGVSAPVTALSALPNCVEQALTALNQTSPTGNGQVICITDIAPDSPKVVVIEDYMLKALSDSIKMGDAEQAKDTIHKLLLICRREPMTLRDYRTYLLEIFMTFLRIGRDLDIARPPNGEPDIYEKLLLCPPIDVAAGLLMQVCTHFTYSIAEKRVTSSQLFVQQAIAYLRQNFTQEDVTIERVCNHLHISTSYFSAIFRKETQKTFLQYITELRMDTAMNLLASTDLRTAEIAQRVGISDPSYFSYSFKKHFGLSPSQIRKGGDARHD